MRSSFLQVISSPGPVSGIRRTLAEWLFPVFSLLLVFRFAYVAMRLVWDCPGERSSILVFFAVAVLMSSAPGLFLRRWLRIQTTNPFLDLLQILLVSLCFSALLAWLAYAAGVYVRAVLWIGLIAMGWMGIYGLRVVLFPLVRLPVRLARFGRLSPGEWVALSVFMAMVLGVFERNVGTPMVSWDALTSWDKWAADAGVRTGLGRYALGGYPQFLPSLGSIFYKLAGSGSDVFPMEHLLLHGFYVVFLGILVLGVLALGRTLGFPGGFVLCLFFGSGLILEMVVEQTGSVDIPLAAMLCSACALGAAYVRGSWSVAGGDRRVALALFLPLFALAFIKGNGLPWLLVLVVSMGMALRSWNRFRPVMLAFCAVVFPSIAYLFHQVWFGSWHWDSSELSPYLRSHTFVLAHTRDFVLSWAHFLSWVERFGGAYGVPSRWGAGGLLALVMGICLWGTLDRKWRFFAVTGPLALTIWFLTGSYDFRNAAAAWLMILIAIVGCLWNGGGRESPRRIQRWILRGVLVAAVAGSAHSLATLSARPAPVGKFSVYMRRPVGQGSLFTLPFASFQVPIIAALPPDRRHLGVRPWGDICEILSNAPFGKRAEHLLAADGLYRVLAPKGVYMMHKTRYNDQQRYDVALGEPYLRPPPDYENVARLCHVSPYDVPLRLFRPVFRPVDMRVADQTGTHLRALTLNEGESLLVEFDPSEGGNPDLKEGIISLRMSSNMDVNASLRLSDADTARDPYAAYFVSVLEGNQLRLIYWMADDSPELPRFVLTADHGRIEIVDMEWGR